MAGAVIDDAPSSADTDATSAVEAADAQPSTAGDTAVTSSGEPIPDPIFYPVSTETYRYDMLEFRIVDAQSIWRLVQDQDIRPSWPDISDAEPNGAPLLVIRVEATNQSNIASNQSFVKMELRLADGTEFDSNNFNLDSLEPGETSTSVVVIKYHDKTFSGPVLEVPDLGGAVLAIVESAGQQLPMEFGLDGSVAGDPRAAGYPIDLDTSHVELVERDLCAEPATVTLNRAWIDIEHPDASQGRAAPGERKLLVEMIYDGGCGYTPKTSDGTPDAYVDGSQQAMFYDGERKDYPVDEPFTVLYERDFPIGASLEVRMPGVGATIPVAIPDLPPLFGEDS